jgi:hypothetical protein
LSEPVTCATILDAAALATLASFADVSAPVSLTEAFQASLEVHDSPSELVGWHLGAS